MRKSMEETSVSDKMLLVLYENRSGHGYIRLSETLESDCDWRNTAHILYVKGYIEYPDDSTYHSTGRITQKGIDYIEKNYG